MCVLLLSLGQHRKYPLVVAANRDELLARPTQAAGFWQDAPQLLAGRDLSQGGTWLGITRDGRFAALTNFRDPPAKRPDRPSRGYLISAFLQGSDTPSAYVTGLAARAHEYNGFSLIVGHGGEFYYYANREREPRALAPGLYGLSNHLLDTPWPKVVRGKQALAQAMSTDNGPSAEQLFAILADRAPADETELPDAVLGGERELWLSPLFISGSDYGTRSSTVLWIDNDGEVTFIERTFQGGPERYSTVEHRFRLNHGK
jgi:uncharacterized protein with NRDE domain